ncbi:hypothetical protein ACFUTX_04600 [Microbacterium sp. NPDC057407]|uniref:hypothetical protein n=1 Tax=Microbacterium sp. NPDC057407 TaxID=3346120 RepID=UPI00367314F0
MKRIDIVYGGEHYSVGGRDPAELRSEIAHGLASGVHWLEVNDGEGATRTAYLALTPGTPISVIPVPEAEDAAHRANVDGAA